jgi:hypothetical protein
LLRSIIGVPSGDATIVVRAILNVCNPSNNPSNKLYNLPPNTIGSVGNSLFTVPKNTEFVF